MFNQFLKAAQEMYESREAFAIAFVINRKHPSSGKPGDKAVIKKNGSILGWIGGGCTKGIIYKEALAAMADGKPRVVKISPDHLEKSTEGVMTYMMTCHSGGSVDVYIEPVLPKPALLIFGRSHIGMALEKIAKSLDYQVNVVLPEVDRDAFPNADQVITTKAYDAANFKDPYIVVCTQGEGDETSLHLALKTPSKYLAFVASRKKANAVYQTLRSEGVTFDELKRIKTPAGIDINAKLPEEVAISILAEMIALYRKEDQSAMPVPEAPKMSEEYYVNPVCQVPVQKANAKHIIEYKGEKVYFCCDGCKVSFEKEPEKYMV